MNNNPTISVLMPMHNASAYLSEAIESVLCQTFCDFELIVVDDGSTDNSVEIAKSYNDSRIRIIQNTRDFISSLNKGVDAATGRYIARMDADDIMLPHRLKTQFEFLEKNIGVDICGSWAECFGFDDRVMQTITQHHKIISSLLLGNSMIHPSMMLRSSVFKQQYYPEGYPCAEDYKLWTILAHNGFTFANIPEVLLRYRRSVNQVTQKYSDTMRKSDSRIKFEYVQLVMEQISQKKEPYLNFFNQLVDLKNNGLISASGLFHTVYHTYTHFLKNTDE